MTSDTHEGDWWLILDCVKHANVSAGKLICSFWLHELPDWLPNVALVQRTCLLLSLHRAPACAAVGS